MDCGNIMNGKYFIVFLLLLHPLLFFGEETASKSEVLRISPVDPFVVSRADDLQRDILSTDTVIALRGFINDWILAGVKVGSEKEADIKVSFEGSAELSSAVDLRVIGEIQAKDFKGPPAWYLDLFKNPQTLGDLSSVIRNWEAIYEFPRLHLSPNKPIVILITIKTHSLSAGKKTGFLTFTAQDKLLKRFPIEIEIYPVKLPEDNPIIGHTWTVYKDDEELARLVRDYGINACGYYDNWDMLRKVGFRFFRFSFPLSNWTVASLNVEDDEIVEYLKPIQETVARLKLKPEEWAIEIFDEPFDKNAWVFVAWAIRIRRLWPEARFYANPGYSWTNKNFATVENCIEPLKNYVNVWCPYEEYRGKPEFMRALKQTQRPIWFYTIEYSHSKPRRGGRQLPWLAWRLQLDGWAFYNLKQDEKHNSWTDNVCARMYPGNTMSLWMEGLRQGVQDYKRLWYLKNAGTSEDEITSNILQVIPKGEDGPWGGAEPETYSKIRERIDDLIITRIPQ
jgi:hypothetical protein